MFIFYIFIFILDFVLMYMIFIYSNISLVLPCKASAHKPSYFLGRSFNI